MKVGKLIQGGVYSINENYYILVKELNNSDDIVLFKIKSSKNNIKDILADLNISDVKPDNIFEFLDQHFYKCNRDDFSLMNDGYLGNIHEELLITLKEVSQSFERYKKRL